MSLCRNFELFYNQDNCCFALIRDKGINFVLRIESSDFKHYLKANYYKTYSAPISINVFKDTIELLNAKAIYEGEKRQTYLRMAHLGNKIYIDLYNKAGQCVEIDTNGFRILDESPVMFERRNGMASLPIPKQGGDIHKLKEFINVCEQFPLIVAWILGTLRGREPFPILIIGGEQGCGKSVLTELLRKIIDPSEVLLRGVIKDERDLVATARSSYLIVMDNVSKISHEMMDRLCQTSTGGGFSKRRLFSDADEILIKIENPIVINGIGFLPDRPDFLERSILIELPSFDTGRRLKSQITRDFEAALPELLGAFYSLLSVGLKELQNTKLDVYPRMADFAQFISAAEKGIFWEAGTMLNALNENQNDLASSSIDENIFVIVLLEYLKHYGGYEGTAQELLIVLNKYIAERDNMRSQIKYNPDWPRTAHQIGRLIARFNPYLKRLGVRVVKRRAGDKHGRRIICISLDA